MYLINGTEAKPGHARFQKQGAWGLWWLTVITLGIYRLFWYQRINRELAAAVGGKQEAWGQWWSQIIPFYGIYGLWMTCTRVNHAHGAVGSSVKVGPFMGAILSLIWFGSDVRYIQRRINTLGDIHQSHAVSAASAVVVNVQPAV